VVAGDIKHLTEAEAAGNNSCQRHGRRLGLTVGANRRGCRGVVMADSIGDGWQERWSVMADKAVGGRAESESYEHAQGGKMGVGELLLSTHVRDKAGSPTWGFGDRR
jgi:hypothetical protein